MKYIIYILYKYCNMSYMHSRSIGKAEDHGIIRLMSRYLIKYIFYNI